LTTSTASPTTPLLATHGTCSDCKFWESLGGTGTQHLGRCHFNAPMAPSDVAQRAIWPQCDSSDWCGQWQAVS